MKTFLASICLVLLATASWAQNAALNGRVLDGDMSAEYAIVMLKSNGIVLNGTNTDEMGYFQFNQLQAGNYQLLITYGDKIDTVEVNGVGSNETRVLGDLILKHSVFLWDCFEHYYQPIIYFDETVTSRRYDFEQIRNNPAR